MEAFFVISLIVIVGLAAAGVYAAIKLDRDATEEEEKRNK